MSTLERLPITGTTRDLDLGAAAGPVHESVLDAIGSTPLIRLRRTASHLQAAVYVKLEQNNPGGSVEDRAALWTVRRARADGSLPPGGTIVEGTSGNTGVGLAVVGAQLGHPVVVVVPDGTSAEEIAVLRAYGAEVVVVPGGVPRDDPRHVHHTAVRLAAEIPGGWLAHPDDDPDDPAAHRETTGPEIWAQTQGRLSTFVAGVGTGGTISGAGEFLKSVSGGRVRVVGVDPVSSTCSGGDASSRAVRPGVLDAVVPVEDRDALLTGRRLAREEGLLVGGSAAGAVAVALREAEGLGPHDVVVVLLPDPGRSPSSKNLNDTWLRRNGFLEGGVERPVRDLLPAGALDAPGPISLAADLTVGRAAELAAGQGALGRTPLAVVLPRRDTRRPLPLGDVVGAATLAGLRHLVRDDPDLAHVPLREVADAPLPHVGVGQGADEAWTALGEFPAAWVLVDGRVAGWVRRARLDQGRTPEDGP
ncbi:PLP-dependent cysteine synthase family protein [Kineococcus sp. SYSU DK002]|uniref:PLP-dependent cysteine synthase family protein n=1 Tax=Kineococcus sp. SYSU DK002 TaxID=3383123 RepID=UPI003D7CAEE7